MKSQEKTKIVQEIEAILGDDFELQRAPTNPSLIGGLMAYKSGISKYALDDTGLLIGLNLASAGLDDETWKKIVTLLETEKVQLQALNLWKNEITELVLPFGVRALEKFDVDENPIENLPKETVEEGSAAILNFFKQIEEQEGTVPLYEAKLLIVGEPGAGKTTLLKKLEDPEYIVPLKGDPAVKSTVGINIYEGWKFQYNGNEAIEFKANLWDFGGQEIQYMTHHFFLTPRALYILVADDRKQNTEFDYWFRIINLLGKESDKEKINVLVLLNEINHISISNFSLSKYREDYPGMHIEMLEVDFSKKDHRSDGLVPNIQRMLCGLPHIGDELPRLWVPIRDDLIEIRKERPHITFAEFADICGRDRGGKQLQKEEDQRFLSRYLHRLGVMLHYQEDDFLDNFVILNPQWAVDAVYSVLQDSRVVKNKGRFTKQDLKGFWKEYDRDERARLLTLMLKDRFEICYPSPISDEYIAPQLLPNERPEFEWDSTSTLKFRYQYPFMPKGLISRLIVRLSDLIAGDGAHVWNEGVLVEDKNGCQAQIIQEKTVKEGLEVLEIEVQGDKYGRKYLLNYIRTEVRKIHDKSFKHIDYEEMIPCICEDCVGDSQPKFFEHSELLKYQEGNVAEIDCSKNKIKKVSVRALLEGVFEGPARREEDKDYHFHLNFDPKLHKDIKEIKQGVDYIRDDTYAILKNQEGQQKYLDALLIYAGKHQDSLKLLFEQINTVQITTDELNRVNAFLEERLDQYFKQLPSGNEIAQKWNDAKESMPHVPDAKWKVKLKFNFVFASFEKELSWDSKAALKHIRREINAFRKGEKTFKQLFVEDDEDE